MGTMFVASAQQQASDSLQKVLAHTSDPAQRVQLLLNLKDLNEDFSINLPYSIQLFREAAAIGNTYAMSVAIVPIVTRYATYSEKSDSLEYYTRTLRKMTPGTPEEGFDVYAQMHIDYMRLRGGYYRDKRLAKSHEYIRMCDSILTRGNADVYEQARLLLLKGQAGMLLAYFEGGIQLSYATQADVFAKAYELTHEIPQLHVRKAFANIIYYPLTLAYNQANNYSDQEKLVRDYTSLLDRYYADIRQGNRRPYLYADNSYVKPYIQLMRGAYNVKRNDLAENHFQELQARLLRAKGPALTYNKGYIYETGYLWRGQAGNYAESIQYCDSLIHLINNGTSLFSTNPDKLVGVYTDQSRLLYLTGRYDKAFEAFERTSDIQDSLFTAECNERKVTIRRSHDIDRLKLDETRRVIRNRAIVIISVAGIGLCLIGLCVYFYRSLRRNRAMQADILRHSRKAQESEHMKSTFVNTICGGIGPPLNAISRSAQNLMIADVKSPDRAILLDDIRSNTELLLSTLDNMLEAANLDSLTERLRFENVDIDELCNAEVLSASRLQQGSNVEYIVEAPGTHCYVRTHAKYFSFVVRALLDNAGKFTREGSITLHYEVKNEHLTVTITDTGCGIPPEKRKDIFRPLYEHSSASRGLSLALCNLIAEHLSGSIRLDEDYTTGARFIFITPA